MFFSETESKSGVSSGRKWSRKAAWELHLISLTSVGLMLFKDRFSFRFTPTIQSVIKRTKHTEICNITNQTGMINQINRD